MDWQNLINIAGGAALATIGWFARQLWDSVKELKADIADLRLHVSETYVKKSEMETLEAQMDKRFDRVEQMIVKLYDKIDQKVDKT
jgi:S-adenosylmethionine:tRNA-ribosyltransferase-isomerase (queuine synthetase)